MSIGKRDNEFSLAISNIAHISRRFYSFLGLYLGGSSFDFLSSSGHACTSSAASFAEQIRNGAFEYREASGRFTQTQTHTHMSMCTHTNDKKD